MRPAQIRVCKMKKEFLICNLRKIISVCLLLFVLKNISAETTNFQFGVKGGLNLSTALVNDAAAIKFKPGCHIGGTVDYLFTPKFALQSGLFFSKQGSKIDGLHSGNYAGGSPDYTYIFDAFYLKLPLYTTFRRSISNSLNIHIGFGPYFGYGVGGKTKKILNSGMYSDGSTEIKWDTFGDGSYDKESYWLRGKTLKQFDFGAGVNVDMLYNKFLFGIGLESGIIDIMKDEYGFGQNLWYRNINIAISIGYRF